jgi:hypothetical protein
MIRSRRISLFFTACLFCLIMSALTACRSAFVETTIRNDGDAPVRLIEVDYPSASFGVQTLNAHSSYHYHFKVQGSGPVTLSFTGPDGKTRTANGPELSEGQQGTLTISFDPDGKIGWAERLMKTR